MRDRYKLTIEYDGTGYSGWQEQENARTIQGTLRKAAVAVFQEPVDIQGAGRTDAGVHALGQVAHLVAGRRLRPVEIRNGLNDSLPSNINILDVSPAGRGFHARHDAHLRSYLYAVSMRRSAFLKRYIWWVRDRLDVKAMQSAADLFGGMHNFAAYADKRSSADASTKVLLQRPEIRETGSIILVRVVGSHFLWKMVRRMIGVLVEVGRREARGKFIRPAESRLDLLHPGFSAPHGAAFGALSGAGPVWRRYAPTLIFGGMAAFWLAGS